MNWRVEFLILLGLAQIGVPGEMIYRQETLLHQGREFRLLTAPVDPYDMFRGRYVSLRFQCETIPLHAGDPLLRLKDADTVYAALKTNGDGFAVVDKISETPLAWDNTIKAKVNSNIRNIPGIDKPVSELVIHLPCDQFYLGEDIASKAEQAYQKANRKGHSGRCWADIRIRDGDVALEDVLIDGVSIRK